MGVMQASFRDFWPFLTPPADFFQKFFPRELFLGVKQAYLGKKMSFRTYSAHTIE